MTKEYFYFNEDPVGTETTPTLTTEAITPLTEHDIDDLVSQYNNNIDLYLDGKLVSSCVLKGFPLLKDQEIKITPNGGFDGSISRLAFYNTSLTQEMAHYIYKNGGTYSEMWIYNVPTYVYITILVSIILSVVFALS